MDYYLVLMNRDKVVQVLSFDNEEAQLNQFDYMSKLELFLRQPYYDHIQKCNEVR